MNFSNCGSRIVHQVRWSINLHKVRWSINVLPTSNVYRRIMDLQKRENTFGIPHRSRVRQDESITKHNGRSAEKNGFQILFQKHIISLINYFNHYSNNFCQLSKCILINSLLFNVHDNCVKKGRNGSKVYRQLSPFSQVL